MSSTQTTEQPTASLSPLICQNVSPSAADLNLPSATMPSILAARFGTITTGTITVLNVMHVQCQLVNLTLPGCTFCKFSRELSRCTEFCTVLSVFTAILARSWL